MYFNKRIIFFKIYFVIIHLIYDLFFFHKVIFYIAVEIYYIRQVVAKTLQLTSEKLYKHKFSTAQVSELHKKIMVEVSELLKK